MTPPTRPQKKKKLVQTTNGILTHLVQIQQIHNHIWTLGPHLVSSEGLVTSSVCNYD